MPADSLRDIEMQAWRGFLLTHERIWREIEAGLAPLNVSMAEYSVLALLGEAGPQGMRMSDIAGRRLMSSGGFTRLAERLENRGLIERRPSAADGRSVEAVLTSDGKALLRKAWRQQRSDLRRLFFSRLGDDDLRCLARVWSLLDPDGELLPGHGGAVTGDELAGRAILRQQRDTDGARGRLRRIAAARGDGGVQARAPCAVRRERGEQAR
jgi:DNA-binding MarR family transcriptional regulator